MKKILNYLAALVLAIVCSVATVSAASIKIDNSVNGQTYNAYKIFDVTKDESGNSYAYSIDTSNKWFNVVQEYAKKGTITLTKTSGSATKYVVAVNKLDAADFAVYLNNNKAGKEATATATGDGSTITINVKDAGYYFVDSSLGALCILYTTDSATNIYEKNEVPTIKKETSQTSASVGQTINFKITVKAGGAADTSYIVKDTMSEGLDLDATSISIRVGGKVVEEKHYDILTTDHGFEINFKDSYTATLNNNDEIVITYDAVVNEKAITIDKVTNDATLEYGKTTTVVPTINITNYDFTLKKVNKNNEQLGDAHFKLYTVETGGTEIKLTLVTLNDGTKFYRPALEDETVVEIIAGNVSIKGLASGTYYLEETKAPDGYNQLTERVAVDLTKGDTAITVENTTGAQLPHTGGMGTVLFITIGSIMVLGFGVLLVTKLRISKMYI